MSVLWPSPKQWQMGHTSDLIIHFWKMLLYRHLRQVDMDRIFVLPVVWNWHEMYLWLLPNEIRPNFGQTFTSMPNGIIKIQYHSLG